MDILIGHWMFCCVTTAAQHQTFSVRLGGSLAGRVAGHATSRLWQRNTRWASLVPAPSTSVGSQRRRQTDTLLDTSTSHRCCETFTGYSLWNASISSWMCSFTDACIVWCHSIFPTTSSSSLILIATISSRRHPCS